MSYTRQFIRLFLSRNDSKYFLLWEYGSFVANMPFWYCGVKATTSKPMWYQVGLWSSEILFMDTGFWISHNLHISWDTGIFLWSHLGPGTICVVRPAGVLFLRVINLFESQSDKETDTNETETQREISWRGGEILYPLVYSPKCLQ